MKDAQGLLQSIATKCTATIGESADSDAGENDFRKFVWKMDVKAFAEERLQKLGEALVLFLERVESATNSGKQEEGGVVISGELRQTVLQVLFRKQWLDWNCNIELYTYDSLRQDLLLASAFRIG